MPRQKPPVFLGFVRKVGRRSPANCKAHCRVSDVAKRKRSERLPDLSSRCPGQQAVPEQARVRRQKPQRHPVAGMEQTSLKPRPGAAARRKSQHTAASRCATSQDVSSRLDAARGSSASSADAHASDLPLRMRRASSLSARHQSAFTLVTDPKEFPGVSKELPSRAGCPQNLTVFMSIKAKQKNETPRPGCR